ncbi:MAG: AMP-binding enzyme, partial [Desulfomonilaceae bacterium]
NISSYEVEQILLKHPEISQVSVVPANSEFGDDEVMAVVVPKPQSNLTPGMIISFSKENMPHFWIPRYIRFMDVLPARYPHRSGRKIQVERTGYYFRYLRQKSFPIAR